MGPIDYSIDVKSPFESALQGYQVGTALNQMQQQQAQQQQQQQVLRSLMTNPNPTADDYARATMLMPGLREQFKQAWDMQNTAQQQSSLSEIGQVHAALTNGQPQYAVDIMNRRADALQNSGGPQNQIDAARTLAKVIEQNPNFARTLTGMKLMSIPGGDKVISSMATYGQEQRAQDQAPADLQKKQADAKEAQVKAAVAQATQGDQVTKAALDNQDKLSQISERLGRLGLDRDRLTSEMQMKLYELGQKSGTLDDSGKKIVNESTVNSVAADQAASQMLDLADRLQKTGAGYGGFATASEFLKSATGNQDALTAMRQEYTRIRNSQALKMLPPGPASDKDIQVAMKGFPAETADAGQLASFLRGMAKLQQRESVAESAKAEWVNAVGHLGKPKTDIEVGGVKVPAGSTFTDFVGKFLKSKTDQKAAAQQAQMIQGRSYMRFAQPQDSQQLGSGFYQPNGGQ